MSVRHAMWPKVVLVTTVCILNLAFAVGQITRIDDTTSVPIPQVGHDYIKLLSETVNPANGSLSLRIQLPTARGRLVSLPFAIAYDSGAVHHLYTAYPAQGGQAWGDNIATLPSTNLSQGGWTFTVPASTNSYWVETLGSSAPFTVCEYAANFIFQDANGVRHDLGIGNMDQKSGPGSCSQIGSYTNGGDPQVSATIPCSSCYASYIQYYVQDRASGTTYYFPASNSGSAPLWILPAWIEDRNGNQITSTYTNNTYSFIDTLGRTLISFPTSLSSVTVSAQTYNLQWTTVTSSYSVPSHNLNGTSNICSPLPSVSATEPEISKITLPNTRSYSLYYGNQATPHHATANPYGLPSEIDYPDGAWVQYTWKMSDQYADVAVYPVASPNLGFCQASYPVPVVATRTVSTDGSTISLTQTFSSYKTTWNSGGGGGSIPAWSGKSTDINTKDPVLGNILTHYDYVPFIQPESLYPPSGYPTSTNAIPVESQIKYYDWGNNSSPLVTVSKSWQDAFQLASEATTLANGLVSSRSYLYAFGQTSDVKETDFGQGSPGALLRHTVISFQSFTGPSIVDHGLRFGRPSSTITYDGAGARVAETDYAYDQTPVSSITGVEQHDDANYLASFKVRGNLTTKTEKCFLGAANCTDSVRKYTYDETGQVLTTTDPCGNSTCGDMPSGTNHTTSYSYADNYDSNPSAITNALLSQITNSLGHISKFKFAFSNSRLIQSQDQNDIQTGGSGTTYAYNDSLQRLTGANYPDGGQTTYSYDDTANSVTTATLIDNSIYPPYTRSTTEYMDGVGRLKQTQLTTDPQGTDFTDTTYDGLGRVWKQSNAYRSSPSTTDGTTGYVYDALGRVCLMVPPDITTIPASCPTSAPIGDVFTSYSGNCTTVTDEAGKSRESCIDGLGRLTQVFEDPTGVNYETDYGYDALNNLISVTQNGTSSASARVRTFTYDSLSRLVCASNPENSSAACTAAALTGYVAGTTGYKYDANGNLSSRTSALHNQTGTATVATNYHYDALNRLVSKTYSDGTSPVQYGYDGTALSGCITAPPSLSDPYPIGRRTAMCDGSGATSRAHDSMGRIASETRTIKGNSVVTKTTTYVYNVDGSLQSTTYPSGYYIYNGYDQAQRPNFVGDLANPGVSYIDDATYTPSGLLTGSHGADTGNGPLITNSLTYNNRLQPTSTAGTTSSNTFFSLSYAYGPTGQNNGNISTMTNTLDATRTVNVNYDSFNRIANAITTNWGEAYTIDAWGNMTAINSYQGKAHESLNCGPANAQNQLSTCYVYDSVGNLIKNGSTTYTYDGENRLVGTAGWTYVYDGDGNRVKKVSTAGTLYWPDTAGRVLSETDLTGSSKSDYVSFNGQRIARFDPKTRAMHYYFSNQVGSHVLVTNATGACEQDIEYYPYGGQRKQYCATPVAENYKFTGKERDSESGLDDFGARYYGSSLGRFMRPDDPFVDQDPSNPQSWNLYSYVRNNPLSNTDPTGNACVQGANGKFSDDNSGGESCAQVDIKNTTNLTPSAQVTSTPIDSLADIPANELANGIANLTTVSSLSEVGVKGITYAQTAEAGFGLLRGLGSLLGLGEGAAGAARGGIGPVLKGVEGVEKAAAEVEAEGGQVLGREITVETSAGRARVDLVYKDASGNLVLGEAKNGPTAALNPNQQRVFQALKNEGGRLVGGNARNAGLPSTIGPGAVRVFKY